MGAAAFNIILNGSANQEATERLAHELRAKRGTAIVAMGDGGVADIIKAGADFRLNANRANNALRSTKEAKKVQIAQLRGPFITSKAPKFSTDSIKIFRKLFLKSASSMFILLLWRENI